MPWWAEHHTIPPVMLANISAAVSVVESGIDDWVAEVLNHLDDPVLLED